MSRLARVSAIVNRTNPRRGLVQFNYDHRQSNYRIVRSRVTMSKKIIRGIMHAITCLTPSPKKQKKEKNDSEDEKVNLPRNDALIANAVDEPRFANKTEVRDA
ncbi:hypothetical protein ALC62_04250 [Cyphomyrmex costatus]|uniref:Uncharacterized protein n=1 Tax=Cyphomyrmex costatus TaxID=456900 RepID=A0A195CW12_9HYME|nr:hypothetical protein ALC62_04250 [Cyphomyrmex costatus]